MTAISVHRDASPVGVVRYHAVAQGKQSSGSTLGEAIDGLTPQLDDELPTLIVIQNLGPDRFFNAAQQSRLRELMNRWRAARDAGTVLAAGENAELEALIDTEVQASGKRAAALLREAGP